MEVHYNDLARPSVRQKYPEMVEKLRAGGLILPAVFLDEEAVSQGYVDYFSISKAVEMARSGPRTAD